MCGLRDIADTRAGVSVLPAASGMTSASVDGVLACVVFVPSAPLLVPELAGPDAVDTLEARSAVRDAGVLLARHATRWVAVVWRVSSTPYSGSQAASAPIMGSATSARRSEGGKDV